MNQDVGKINSKSHNNSRTIHEPRSRRQYGGEEEAKVKPSSATLKERREGRMKDALALGGDEGRDKLR